MNFVTRLVATTCVALSVGACATLPGHNLSEAEISSLTLASVKVTFPHDGSVNWAEAEALEAKERETPKTDLQKAEHARFRSYAEHRLAAALTTESHRLLGSVLRGTRPARLEITVRDVLIPTTQERTGQMLAATAVTAVLAGPIAAGVVAGTTPGIFITCDVALVDVATNRVLASLDEVKANSPSAQFSGESVDSIAAALLTRIKGWLSEKAAA